MLTRPLLFATALLAVCIAGCDKKTTGVADAGTPAAPAPAEEVVAPMPAEAAPPAVETPLSQVEALAMLTALNDHEIAAAEQARTKGVTGAVLEYADLLHEEHVQNLADTTEVATATGSTSPAGTTDTAPVVELRAKGQQELRTLDALAVEAYSKAYIDAMVKGHEEALALIDDKLLPAATDDAVREHFTATRAHIAMHLDEGKRLQTR